MQLLTASLALLLAAQSTALSLKRDTSVVIPTDTESLLNGKQLQALHRNGRLNLDKWRKQYPSSNGCTAKNTAKRREFTKMSKAMRKNFTDAVTCLHSKPSALNGNASYPGVKNRLDDFTVGHIEFDDHVHFTGTFLTWHRYVIWTFEQELRSECGYQGYLPYWNWGMYAEDPTKSPMFNGDAYSMGSNGKYIEEPHLQPMVFSIPLPHSYLETLPNPQTNVTVPIMTGTGGGCIDENGPFGSPEWAHIGPTILDAYNMTPGHSATGNDGREAYAYRPRCLTRDLNPWVTQQANSYMNITQNILNFTDLAHFQGIMQSDSRYLETIGNIGVHAGGHIGVGGEPMADQPSPPGDPMWYLHHASIDWMWSIWQQQDIANRLNQTCVTNTNFDYPASAPDTLQTVVDLQYMSGTTSPPLTAGELVSSIDGPFCYEYVW